MVPNTKDLFEPKLRDVYLESCSSPCQICPRARACPPSPRPPLPPWPHPSILCPQKLPCHWWPFRQWLSLSRWQGLIGAAGVHSVAAQPLPPNEHSRKKWEPRNPVPALFRQNSEKYSQKLKILKRTFFQVCHQPRCSTASATNAMSCLLSNSFNWPVLIYIAIKFRVVFSKTQNWNWF